MRHVNQWTSAKGGLYIDRRYWSGTRRAMLSCKPFGTTYAESGQRETNLAMTSPTVDGQWLLNGRFRAPTNYSLAAVNVTPSGATSFRTNTSIRNFSGLTVHHPPIDIDAIAYHVGNGNVNIRIDQNLHNRLMVEVANKVADAKVNALVALAESKKTLTTVISLVRKLIKVWNAVRRGNFRQAYASLGMSGPSVQRAEFGTRRWFQGWLAIQYGLLPLMSDLYGAQEAFKRGLRENDQMFSATRTSTYKLDDFCYLATSPGNTEATGDGFTQLIKAKVWFKISDSRVDLANSLGITNPAAAAWELVPYSFVIDWILPIGSMLSAITASNGVSFVAGSVLHLHSGVITYTDTYTACESNSKLSVTVEAFAMKRVRLGEIPITRLYVRNPFSTKRVISAIALIASATKRA